MGVTPNVHYMGKVKDWHIRQMEKGISNPDISEMTSSNSYANYQPTSGPPVPSLRGMGHNYAAGGFVTTATTGAFPSPLEVGGSMPSISPTRVTKVAWKVLPCVEGDDMGMSDMVGEIVWPLQPHHLQKKGTERAFIVLVDENTKCEDPTTYLGAMIADVLKLGEERFRLVHEIKELK